MEKAKSVTPEDKATFFADENYPAKFADNKWDALYTAYHSGYLDGTRYEREQQAPLLRELEEFKNGNLMDEYTVELSDKVEKLEAERTELRNKVIDECIEVLMKADLLEINLAYEKLNSLKTK